jgi:23S rRNA pseudouridine2605 synthase
VKRDKSISRSSSSAKPVGIARALSKFGYCSRSQAARLVREGRVRLNGAVTKNPEAPVRLAKDRIHVDGKFLGAAEKIYLLLNKPRGIITTASDEKGRDTVYSLLPSDVRWISPVGRLDQASEGLLLFTNDSEWAARIMDPASRLDKTYHVQIGTLADDQMLRALERGVEVTKGEMLKAKRATILRSGEKHCWLEIILDEGKNRHIRRMLKALGVEVLRLIRVSLGPVTLGELAKGAHRILRAEEKEALDSVLRPAHATL